MRESVGQGSKTPTKNERSQSPLATAAIAPQGLVAKSIARCKFELIDELPKLRQ